MRTRTWLHSIWICVALLVYDANGVSAAQARRLLLLHSFGRDSAPWNDYSKNIRTELDRQSPEPVDLFEASLATARFGDNAQEGPFVDYLRALFAEQRLDLVVTVGAPAASFFPKYRQQLFPSTPVLFAVVEQRQVSLTGLTANDAVVAISIDIAGVVDNIRRVLPDTTTIAVVIGNSPIEKYWLGQMRGALQPFTDRITFAWFNDLSFAEMLKRAAALPPRSAIFFALLSVDAAGVPHEEGKAFASLHAVANAPMFSYVDAYFGHGIVGGPLVTVRDVSQQAASVAVRILRGEAPGSIKSPPVGFGTPRFDWRELKRWNISAASLPPGSIVQFREPALLEEYRWHIIAGVSLCVLEAAFIVVLLASRRRLRRAEEAAQELSARLIRAQEEERARLARELHDDVTQRLAILAIEAGRGERVLPGAAGGAAMRTLREGLVTLSEDVHALSYRLHPSILEDLGLIEALKAECETFSRRESVEVDVKAQEIPEVLTRDVALGLFRVTQEALRNVARHARAKSVEVSLGRLDGGLQLAVRDDGVGFDPAHHRSRASLGHASMRQRISLLGGELDIESTPGHGTTVLAWVPVKEKQGEPSARAAG